ncbi:MAG: hypothetical protein QOH29_2637 [Actinomycetota bacterium]|jgi:hypothetical protein|nr:hypothetical protein [Actinomycetota bacterium]
MAAATDLRGRAPDVLELREVLEDPPSAMPDGGELLGQAAAERRQECENA